MDAGGGLTGSQHSRSGYSLATAAPAAATNSSHAAANMTAAAVRLSLVHHLPGTGRPRGSIKRRRLLSAILEKVVDHVFFSLTAIVVAVATAEETVTVLPYRPAVQ